MAVAEDSEQEVADPCQEELYWFGRPWMRQGLQDLQRTAPVSSINGIATDGGETVEVNTIEGEKTKRTRKASIRFIIADVQRPLAAASNVMQKKATE